MLEGQSILPEHLILLGYINKIYYLLLQSNLVKLINPFLKCITSSLILLSKLNFGIDKHAYTDNITLCTYYVVGKYFFIVYSYIVLKTMPSAFLCTVC